MRTLAVFVAVVAFFSVSFAKDETQASDVVKKNLDSIGTAQARAAVKNRAVEGTLQFKVLNGGAGTQDGKQVLLTEGDKLVSLLKLPNPSYHGERFVSDGKKTSAAQLKPGVYSNLGLFVQTHNEILTEGLWGGVLSTGWALADLDAHKAKVKYQGLKKIEGRELHRVDYQPKHSDLQIQLYFEPETFRHVLTIYELTIKPQMALTEQATAQQQETHYRLEERFADFKNTDNLTLPGKWTIQFTSDVPETQTTQAGGGTTTLGGAAPVSDAQSTGHNASGASIASVNEFVSTVNNVASNVPLDPKTFEIK